jgi:hypothetical protein
VATDSSVLLTVGTKKGAFLLRSSARRDRWELTGPFVAGLDVNHVVADPRDATIFATANDPWFGPQVRLSRDHGASWVDARASPRFAADPVVEPGTSEPWFMRPSAVMERLWRVEPGRASEPGVLFCGTGPAALFRSGDGGATWEENAALSSHPTKQYWNPGAGGLILHSIVLDPENANRMWVGISAAGVFRTEDGGASWQPMNDHIKEPAHQFDPNVPLYPEAGQCVHHIEHAAGSADRLYMQAHWGTYRSDDGATHWTEITDGLPSEFGLAMAAHPHDPDTAYVVPLQGGELRCPPEGKLRVFRTRDAGSTWEPLTEGLPQNDAFMGVYRDGLCCDRLDPAGVYFGTNTGQLYASANGGDSWTLITRNLPPITSVAAASI